jgi:hypothetical protein
VLSISADHCGDAEGQVPDVQRLAEPVQSGLPAPLALVAAASPSSAPTMVIRRGPKRCQARKNQDRDGLI